MPMAAHGSAYALVLCVCVLNMGVILTPVLGLIGGVVMGCFVAGPFSWSYEKGQKNKPLFYGAFCGGFYCSPLAPGPCLAVKQRLEKSTLKYPGKNGLEKIGGQFRGISPRCHSGEALLFSAPRRFQGGHPALYCTAHSTERRSKKPPSAPDSMSCSLCGEAP